MQPCTPAVPLSPLMKLAVYFVMHVRQRYTGTVEVDYTTGHDTILITRIYNAGSDETRRQLGSLENFEGMSDALIT